eukprot:7805664-Pyramimonas_sp.AAC.2
MGGAWKPTGRECDDCRCNRRKYHKGPKTGNPITLNAMIEKRKGPIMEEKIRADRSSLARGDTKHARVEEADGAPRSQRGPRQSRKVSSRAISTSCRLRSAA